MNGWARLFRVLSLDFLAGPIFGKELRVLSRRGRHYWLRGLHIALLSFFVVITWINVVDWVAGPNSVYRMSDAGKTIITTIVWFQFVTLQLVAVAMMSTAVSEEVHHRTLGVLLTTPITRWQIVGGKMLARLVQLVLLLLISLPLLSLVRVFGGVPIGYVLGSACMTITAGLFVGAVAIFYSTLFRKAYASFLLTLATLAVLQALLPLIAMLLLAIGAAGAMASGSTSTLEWTLGAIVHINPFWALSVMTMETFSPQMGGQIPFSWGMHCLVMLGATALVLLPTVVLVRKAARRAIVGRTTGPGRGPRAVPAPSLPTADAPDTNTVQPPPMPAQPRPAAPRAKAGKTPVGPVREITGSPMVWRKLRTPMIQSKALRVAALCVVIALMAIFYALLGKLDVLGEAETQAAFVVALLLCGMVPTAVFSATTISSEREARTLPLLLTTTLSDGQVIFAYVVETLRRSLPAWCLLFAHVLVFVLFGVLHVSVLAYLLVLVVWLAVFLAGMGMWVSSIYRRTTAAVVVNLAMILVVWALAPLVMGLLDLEIANRAWANLNPFVQAVVLTEGCATEGGAGEVFDWPGIRGKYGIDYGPGRTLECLGIALGVYGLAASGGFWRAKRRLRRNLFAS